MNTETENKDILKNLFSDMQEEPLPASFRMNVMERVMQESAKIKKRNERWSLLAVIIASLGILALAALSLIYMDLPKMALPKINLSALHFYLFIGTLSLVLLYLDYRLRRLFRKDE